MSPSGPASDDTGKKEPPLGVRVIRRLRGKDSRFRTYRCSVLILTFFAYASYHSARKPFSIVKSVLDDVETDANFVNGSHVALYPFLPVNHLVFQQSISNGSHRPHWYYGGGKRAYGASREGSEASASKSGTGMLQGWAPFNKSGGKGLLGDVDLAFLASYAVGMYFSGHFGDTLDLRYFLSGGMIAAGLGVSLFGLAYWLNVHSIYYFLTVQVISGLLQSTGWPSVVSVMGKWFGKRKRGLIMGIWNAHTSIGNITGSLLAAQGLAYGWGWSFLFTGLLLSIGGVFIFLFLVVEPSIVGMSLDAEEGEESSNRGLRSESGALSIGKSDVEEATRGLKDPEIGNENKTENSRTGDEETGLLQQRSNEVEPVKKFEAVGFIEAWKIPGVAPFALCLFFSKLVAYTFLNWLPFYITQTKINGRFLSDRAAGNLSTLFDVGGVIGGILAGQLSDSLKARALVASGFVYTAIPALFLYRTFGNVSMPVNIALMVVAGAFVNGPYALITTAVSADLGTHASLKGNPRALATVTAIIDGTGSVGAAVGPLLTGYISEVSWDYVFMFLMLAALIAGLLLTRLVIEEVRKKMLRRNSISFRHRGPSDGDGVGGSLSQRLLDGRR